MSSQQWHKPPRLYEDIARDLTESIVQGRLAPGEFLPTEQELADRYGASRNVIREALKMLGARGLVEALHGRGSRILPRHRWRLRDQLDKLIRGDRQLARSLVELRRILEVAIAGLAAERATPEQIEAMRVVLQREQDCAGQLEATIEHDYHFHRLLAEATGNVLLPETIEPFALLIRAHAHALVTERNQGAVESAISSHAAILDRVEAGDAVGAREAMQHHLSAVERGLDQVFADSQNAQDETG